MFRDLLIFVFHMVWIQQMFNIWNDNWLSVWKLLPSKILFIYKSIQLIINTLIFYHSFLNNLIFEEILILLKLAKPERYLLWCGFFKGPCGLVPRWHCGKLEESLGRWGLVGAWNAVLMTWTSYGTESPWSSPLCCLAHAVTLPHTLICHPAPPILDWNL